MGEKRKTNREEGSAGDCEDGGAVGVPAGDLVLVGVGSESPDEDAVFAGRSGAEDVGDLDEAHVAADEALSAGFAAARRDRAVEALQILIRVSAPLSVGGFTFWKSSTVRALMGLTIASRLLGDSSTSRTF